MTEGDLQKKIKDSLNSRSKSHFDKIHGGQFQRGISDLVGTYRSISVHLEVKLPTNKKGATDLQKAHLERVRRAGGVAAVVDSVAKANAILDRIDKRLDGK